MFVGNACGCSCALAVGSGTKLFSFSFALAVIVIGFVDGNVGHIVRRHWNILFRSVDRNGPHDSKKNGNICQIKRLINTRSGANLWLTIIIFVHIFFSVCGVPTSFLLPVSVISLARMDARHGCGLAFVSLIWSKVFHRVG